MQEACRTAADLVYDIRNLPSTAGSTSNITVAASPLRRHLHILAITRSHCMNFVTTLLSNSLRHVILEGNRNDDCIGFLIILIQVSSGKQTNNIYSIEVTFLTT